MPFWGRGKGGFAIEDRLTSEDLLPQCCLQTDCGVPSTADTCAYEPIQKLLAVSVQIDNIDVYRTYILSHYAFYAYQIGTADGRVKLLGKQGVEKSLFSASRVAYGTKQLKFVTNRGILVRVSEVHDFVVNF